MRQHDDAVAMADSAPRANVAMSQLVQRKVERMIMSGDLKAGERISEQSIAENLGISRGPVREAFRTLTEAGLLVAHRNRGVTVREISREELIDLYEVRAALEGEIAAAAALNMTEDVLTQLEFVLRDMAEAAGDNVPEAYFAANVQFDALIIAACPNRKLRDVYRSVTRQMLLVRRQRLQQSDDMKRSLAEHTVLLESLQSGRQDEVRTAFRDHILRARKRIAAE